MCYDTDLFPASAGESVNSLAWNYDAELNTLKTRLSKAFGRVSIDLEIIDSNSYIVLFLCMVVLVVYHRVTLCGAN